MGQLPAEAPSVTARCASTDSDRVATTLSASGVGARTWLASESADRGRRALGPEIDSDVPAGSVVASVRWELPGSVRRSLGLGLGRDSDWEETRTGKRLGLGRDTDWEETRSGTRLGLGRDSDWEVTRTTLTTGTGKRGACPPRWRMDSDAGRTGPALGARTWLASGQHVDSDVTRIWPYLQARVRTR